MFRFWNLHKQTNKRGLINDANLRVAHSVTAQFLCILYCSHRTFISEIRGAKQSLFNVFVRDRVALYGTFKGRRVRSHVNLRGGYVVVAAQYQ